MQPQASPSQPHDFEIGQTLNLLWPTRTSNNETIDGVEVKGLDNIYGEPCVYRGDYPLDPAAPITLLVVQLERTGQFLGVEPKDLSAHATA